MELDTKDEKDILDRYLVATIENYYEGVVLRNPVHTALYTGHQIV